MRWRNPGLWLAIAALTICPPSIDVFELPHQVILALGSLVMLALGVRHNRWLGWAAVGVFGLGVITTVTSSIPLHSVLALVSMGVLLTFSTTAEPFDVRPVLWTTWPLAIWALLQATGHDFIEWAGAASWCGGTRPFASLGHPTQLGIWMAAVAVLAFSRPRSAFYFATGLVAALVCVLTLSRAGWLTLMVGLGCWGWFRRRGQRSWPMVAAVAIAVTVPALVVGPAAVVERLTHFFTSPTRVHLWTTAWQGFLKHPMLGWGLDTFMLVDQQFRHPEVWRFEWGSTAAHAHSALPQILATQGTVGIVCFGALAVLVVRRWRHIPSPELDAGAVAAVVGLTAASAVAFSSVLLAALGLCVLTASLNPAGEKAPRSLVWLASTSGLVLTGLMFAASIAASRAAGGDLAWLAVAQRLEPWNALWAVHEGAALEKRGELGPAKAAFEKGASLAPGVAVYEANVGRVASARGDAEASRRWFELARRHAPLDARIARDAAEASLALGDLEVAEQTLIRSLALYPTDGPTWLTLTSLRFKQHRPLDARAALEASLGADWRDWPEGPTVARAVLVTLLEATGDKARAAEVARAPAVWASPADICGAPAFLSR